MLLMIVGVSTARADVVLRVQESSWSIGRQPAHVQGLVETAVKAAMRRVETEGAPDSAGRPTRSVQIDRIDRDSSYYFRAGELLYLPVALAGARASNRRGTETLLEAKANGGAPRDTIAPVRTLELGRSRSILGTMCKGLVLELVFSYRDSALTGGEQLTGVLSDTVWLAPAGSAAGELKRFESEFARATASDSLLAAANAVQLTRIRGQGLVSVLQRAVRALPGYPLESTFVNVLHGLPRGLSLGEEVERQPDGAVVVQRTVRRAVGLSDAPIPAARFELPPGAKPVQARR